MLQESANILLMLAGHSKLENSPCSSTGMALLVCRVQLEKALVHILNLGGLSYQFWRDRGEESLEEFSHLSPLQGRAVNLFIQLLNCRPEFFKRSLETKDINFHSKEISFDFILMEMDGISSPEDCLQPLP